MIVPNKFPIIPSGKRIALIGEAPGADEEKAGQPFVGTSGRFLASLLSRAGIAKDACFLGNISQHRPEGNDFSLFSWNGLQVQHGLTKLKEDLEIFKPNIIVLLGNIPLKAAKDCSNGHHGSKVKFKNAQWRGSLFRCDDQGSPFFGHKCLPTYHPAYCLRDYEATPLLQFDLRKAVRESDSGQLDIPLRRLETQPSCEEVLARLRHIDENRVKVAIDIEGGISTMSCISFAIDPTDAFIVPFFKRDGTRCWNPEEENKIWRALTTTLENPHVPKVLQNSLYDRFVLHYSYGIRVCSVQDDTMLKHWELYSELEKSLGVQASIYTDEPYYKGDRKSDDDTTFFEYCCRDSAVTLEISNKLDGYLSGSSLNHYRLNVALLNPMLYMECRGIKYDSDAAYKRRFELRSALFTNQARLNGLVGTGFKWTNHEEIKNHIRENFYTKKGDRLYKDYEAPYARILELLNLPTPTLATMGEIEDLCKVSFNTSSNKQFTNLLYETLKLPVQFNNDKENPRPTADYEALLKLSKICQEEENDPRLPIIQLAIVIRALGTREGMLGISADRDGRIRCGYNIVGSNTGRITCYESPTGSGYNLQTIPNYTDPKEAPGGVIGDRDLFLADEGHWFFQCDLKGADGWTVAAYCAMLGDTTMLDDYMFGLKPANILALMLRGVTIPKERVELKTACSQVGKDDWDYFACKRVQHGCSYLEGGLTVSRNILKDSEGKLSMTQKECEQLKGLFFQRYWGIQKWHNWVAGQIRTRPVLTAASGQVRQFFGRPDEILTKAVAFEPQANTTFATNLATFRLWTDLENRNGKKLRVEPLHTIHDALAGQFKKEDTNWAASKIKTWFDNTLTIAGQQINIPYDGAWGISWGNLNEGKL